MIGRLEGIPFYIILMVVLSALLIYFVFFVIDKYYVIISKKGKEFYFIKKWLRKVRLFSWFIWFVLSIYFLLIYSPVITLIFLIGFYLFTKDYWINIYSGILFLMNGKIKKGDYIYFPDSGMEGVVTNLLLVELELKNKDDELIYIPFSKVLNNTFLIKEKVSNYFLNDFEILESEFECNLNENMIKKVLLNCPWTVVSKNIDIERTENGYKIKVVSFSKEMAT
ncbi:MAG TPA: mechanosensitive ion channel family protein, partial [Saprospiraceae bacterium]|nr:mechanosensitive ion channel family protein [Saprospiraceae bacterium]